jgi:hypothetical protein
MTKNARSLEVIADDIHKLERASIFDIGELLIEAKAQCKHGDWLAWLKEEFDWSVDTAERYMKVAELGFKFRTVRNLKLSARTLYTLANPNAVKEEDLPWVIKEFEKHAKTKRLPADETVRVMLIGRMRRLYDKENLPDATLLRLYLVIDDSEEWHKEARAALIEQKPDTDEAAENIVDEIEEQHLDAELAAQAEQQAEAEAEKQAEAEAKKAESDEIEAILDGPPPELPPSIVPPEPQTLGLDKDDESAEAKTFRAVMRQLHYLRTKPLTKFAGVCSVDDLREVIEFFTAIATQEIQRQSLAPCE